VALTSLLSDSEFKLTNVRSRKSGRWVVNGDPGPLLLILAQNNKLGISPLALAARTFGRKLVR
jgi:hypothetical protein